MVHIVEKRINGNKYIYLYRTMRIGKKVKTEFVAYLGSKNKLKEDAISRKIKHFNKIYSTRKLQYKFIYKLCNT